MEIGTGKNPTCKSCQQTYGTFDKDLLPRTETLKWHRFGKDPETGVRKIPEGEECYECAQVRSRSMGGIPLEEMMNMRATHKDRASVLSQNEYKYICIYIYI